MRLIFITLYNPTINSIFKRIDYIITNILRIFKELSLKILLDVTEPCLKRLFKTSTVLASIIVIENFMKNSKFYKFGININKERSIKKVI